MHPDVSWAVWSSERARRVEAVMDALLPPADELPQSLHEAMRSGIFAMVGGEHNYRVVFNLLGQAVQRIEDVADLGIDYLHALRVAIKTALPVAVWHLDNPIRRIRTWILLNRGSVLRRIVGYTAPNALREFAKEGLG